MPARKTALRRLALEGLEPRTLLAVLPPATVTSQVDISNTPTNGHETAPSIAINPVSPQKLVAVWTRDSLSTSTPPNNGQTTVFVEGAYSTNAGLTWTALPGTLGNSRIDFDQSQTSGARFFAQVTDAGVAFDGNNQFYVISSPHVGDYSAGEILLQKFDFSGSTPTQVFTNQPVYRWTQDPAFRPVLAVDSNLASFTDPDVPSYVQADPFAGNVYVAWSTTNDVTGLTNANPNVIKIAASSDAATATAATPPTFTTQQYVNDGRNFGSERNAVPRLAISQGRPIDTAVYGVADPGVSGGQVTVVWDDSGTLSTLATPRDRIVTDRIQDGGTGALVAGTTGGVLDAIDPGGGAAHQMRMTDFTADVNITDPRFLSLSDLDVTLDLTHNALAEIRIELIPPTLSGLPTVTLLTNRNNTAGTANTNVGATGANLGTTTSGITLGTVFDDDAPRSIFNNGGGNNSTGHFQPEGVRLSGTGLSAYDDATPGTFTPLGSPGSLNGTWTLRITDFRASGTVTPAPRLNGWSLNFTSGLNDGVDTVAATTLVRGNVGVGNPGLVPAVAPTVGIGPAPVVASDNTLGAFSPHQGRLYVAYVSRPAGTGVPADNTDIALATSDDGGLTWQATNAKVNDDLSAVDGYTESDGIAGRPQFLPAAAVDPATGTLVVTFYDARDDAARARAATYIATSNDGGATFGPQTFANAAERATDAITGEARIRGPLPDNQAGAVRSPFNFGHRADVAVSNGRVYPVWASNLNGGTDGARRLDIYTAQVAIAAGPRVVDSTMGPVGEAGDLVNTTRAADGTPQASNFLVTFDRPIDPTTFDAGDVQLVYRNPAGVTTDLTTTAGIAVTPVPGAGPNDNGRFGFTTFNVSFTPQSGIGTYSYSIGPDVSDRIRATVLGLGTPQTFTSTNNTAARVPQQFTGGTGTANDTTTSFLFVSGHPNQVISSLTVGLNLTHARAGDLTIRLQAPGGTTVTLYQKPADAGQNFVNTVFDDTAAQTIAAGSAPYTGSFRPVTPLSALSNLLVDGLYRLIITDGAGGNIGQLNNWSLTFNTLTPGTTTQAGTTMDQDADAVTGEAVDDLYATPAPLAGGSFAAGPYDQGTLPLIVPGPHVVGTSVPSATAPAPVQFSATSSQVNQPIPDATVAGPGVLTSTITVAGLPRSISDLDVRVSITHPRDADLVLDLIAPDGTVVNLASNRGGGGANYTNTTFDSQAATSIFAGSPPFTGSFRPQGSLNALNGLNPNGVWTLRVTDTAVGNAGTLTDFTLTIITDNAATTDNLVLNDTVNAIDVTFDRDMDPTSFTPASILRIQGPAGLIVPAAGEQFTFAQAAAGNLRTFRIGLPPSAVQFLSGTYTVQFGPGLRDARGNALDQNLNAGVDVLFSRGTTTTPVVAASADTPLAIPDAVDASTPGVLTSTLVVADDFPIQGLVPVPGQIDPVTGLPVMVGGIVVQVNIAHTRDPDLRATLIYHPGLADEVRIPLFSNVGAAGNQTNFTNTVLDDAAATPIQNGGPPFFGRFNPEQSLLSALAGRSSAGAYALEIRDTATGTVGTLLNWSLTFRRPVPNTGLGEAVADQVSASFRIFTTDPTNRLASSTWTAVGPASTNGGANSGRIGGLAVDPSDPTGNTVYVGGASGGIWKTTNFLTTDPAGPIYIPLTDFGPTFAINIGGIAVFGRNNDPNQSIVFAATGEGDTGTPGVGFLRSMDGGATWTLLDSTDNTLPFAQRDHRFAQGTTAFKVVVDPRLTPTGDVIVYAALSGSDAHAGIWRSVDTGRTWQRLLAGQATDVLLDPNSGTGVQGGNLQFVYAGVRGQGVFFSPNRGQTFTLVAGGVGNPLIQDADRTNAQVNPLPPSETPNGPKGRIVLAKPFLTGNAVQDLIYQGWLYVAVATPDSRFDGLYVTKDFGQNWTKLRIPTVPPSVTGGVAAVRATPTNDLTQPDYDVGGGPAGTGLPAQLNYDISFAIDPTNPNILYLGGTNNGQPSGFIRIDATLAADAHSLVPFDNNRPDGGLTRLASNAASNNAAPPLTLDDPINLPTPAPFYNLIRDPARPFVAGATIVVRNSLRFNNNGGDVRWMPFDFGVTDQHRIVTFIDPVTGRARLIIGDDQGVHTAVDDNGTFVTAVGTQPVPFGPRSGNLQITQFYYGASQPSSIAAQVAATRALFYGQAQDDGFPRSDPDLLNNGNITWSGGLGDGTGVATDPQGLGTLYQYNWPCCGGNRTDFFQVDGAGRTFGLLQQSNSGPTPDPQWPNLGGSNFAVNPLTGQQIIMSSPISGRLFGTENRGLFWSVIGEPSALDGTYVQAPAYGAPDPFGPGGIGNLNSFLYAGTTGGRIFVTQTGGGTPGVGNQWTNISTGLDGSALQAIITNPTRGSHEAYAVTARGVYRNTNTVSVASGPFAGPAQPWVNITGNLFQVMHDSFGDPMLAEPQARGLTSIVADWRYVIPDATGGGTHPVLYVGAQAGVYRSLDSGATWELFPNVAFDGSPRDGGFLPVADVRDLDLAVGNINPQTGRAEIQPGDPNILLATTFGRGSFAIRLAPIVFPNTAAQPDILALLPADQVQGNTRITANPAPTIVGLSAQSAFGNLVTITVRDAVTGAVIGTGQTDPNGIFQIPVQAYTTSGLKVVDVQATDQSGTTGNVARLSFFVQLPGTPFNYIPDLTPDTDNGRPAPPRDSDDLTNVALPSFQGTMAGGNLLDPSTTVATIAAAPTGAIHQPDNTVTITTTAAHGLVAGQVVMIAGVGGADPDEDVAAYNGIFTVTGVPSPTTFTYTLSHSHDDLPASGGGTVIAGVMVTVFVNGTAAGTVTTDTTGAYRIDLADPEINPAGVTLAEGSNTITVQETRVLPDGTFAVGPMSLPLTVTLDTSPPAAISPLLLVADDSGFNADNVTSVITPRFVNSIDPATSLPQPAEPFALVQIFVQQVDAQGQLIDLVPLLAGEAVADAVGNYVVQIGTYVQPAPPVTIPNLADGIYLITARQVDVAGNNGQSQGFGSPGTVIIDGTDANDHGFFDTATQTNQEGWAYIEEALNNIGPNVTNGNRVVVALGTIPSQTNGTGGPGGGFGGQAGGAIFHPFRQSNLPALGWTLVYIDGATTDLNANGRGDLDEFLSGLPVTAQSFLPGTDGILGTADDVLGTVPNVQFGGAVPAGGVGTGILYVTTANNSSGDIDSAELNIINAHGADIARYVTGGGGLFSHAETAGSTFVQIAAAPTGATEVGNTVTITTVGAHGLTVGQPIQIFGGGLAAGYRGNFTIASVPSPTTFTYFNPTTGLAPSGGGFVFSSSSQAAYGWLTAIFPGITVVQDSVFSLTGITITPEGMQAFPSLTAADLSTGPWHNFFSGDLGVLVPLATAINTAGEVVPLILTSIGVTVQPLTVTIDATAPVTPTGLDLQDASDSLFNVADATGTHVVGSTTDNYTNDTSPTFDVAAVEAGTSVTLFRDATPVATVIAAADGTLSLTDPGPVPDGVHLYQVRQQDPAGNVSGFSGTLSVRFDTSLPAVPSAPRLLPADDSGTPGDNLTNVPQPRLTGTATPAAGEALPTVQVVDSGGTILGEAVVAPNGTYTVTPNITVVTINTFTVRTRTVDQAGNISALSPSFTLTVDRQGPLIVPSLALSPLDDSGIPGDNVTNVRQPNLIGRSDPGLSVDLQLVGPAGVTTLVSGVRTGADGSFQVRFPGALADGTYQVRARAYDAANNESFSPLLTLVIDATAPAVVPTLALAAASDTGVRGDSRTSTRRPILVGSLGTAPEPGARAEIIDAAGNVVNVPAATVFLPGGLFAAQLASDLVNGSIPLRARLRDAAGNAGPAGPALNLAIVTIDGDYDVDGRADLALYQRGPAAAPTSGQFSILRSSLGPQARVFGGRDHIPVQGDFDGDGITDLVTFDLATATWFIAGSRGTNRTVQFGPAGLSLPVPADFDGDGITDLAAYRTSSSGAEASFWFILRSSDGVTQTVPFGGVGFEPIQNDFDGDGRADVACYFLSPNDTAPSQWVILGSATGPRLVPFAGRAFRPVPADFDGDGRTDIAAYQPSTNPADPSRWVILRSSDGAGQLVPFGGSNHIPAPRDYDGDGRADVATFAGGSFFVLNSSTGVGVATPLGAPSDVALPSPLVPYRIASLAPNATAAAANTVRAAAVEAPKILTGSDSSATDFGRTAAGLAAGSSNSSRPRAVPAQAPVEESARRTTRRLRRVTLQDDAGTDALDRLSSIRVDRLVARLRR